MALEYLQIRSLRKLKNINSHILIDDKNRRMRILNAYKQDIMKLSISFSIILLFLICHNVNAQSTGNWTSIGPKTLPYNLAGQPNGMGRINAIAFDPADT